MPMAGIQRMFCCVTPLCKDEIGLISISVVSHLLIARTSRACSDLGVTSFNPDCPSSLLILLAQSPHGTALPQLSFPPMTLSEAALREGVCSSGGGGGGLSFFIGGGVSGI